MNAVNRARLKTVVSREVENGTVLAARGRAMREWGYLPGETGTSLWATAATFMQAGIETYDLRPRLRSLTVPFLVLVGEHDPLLMGAAVDQAVAPMPLAAVRRVPGLAHTLDRPEVIAAEVVAFVRERAGVDRSG